MNQIKAVGYIFEDQRRANREDVVLKAQGFIPHIDEAIDCTILDLSDTGARVELKSVDMVPRKFTLFAPDTHTLWDCRVVRRDGKQIGVAFNSKIDLSEE